MKAPAFIQGIGVALLAAVGGELLYSALPLLIGKPLACLLTISLLTLAYLLYLIRGGSGKAGRATLLALWGFTSFAAWALGAPLPVYLLPQLGFIWLTRSLYYSGGAFRAFLELGLQALAASAAAWAFIRTGSVFLALWSFFLIEAFFPLPAASGSEKSPNGDDPSGVNPRFEQAHRTALVALQRLTFR